MLLVCRPWGKGTKEWRHLPATKSYHLHVGVQTTPATLSSNLPPIDSFTVALHDALFSGLFLQEAAARRYISLHKTTPPYRYDMGYVAVYESAGLPHDYTML